MAKILNKKEQVIDIQLTPYGRHVLSNGKFEPAYYAFFDNNIVYDGQYFSRTETQNEIGQRIKKETQYLQSLVQFKDLDAEIRQTNPVMETYMGDFFTGDVLPINITPDSDSYRYTSIIGDARIDGQQQLAPAWKVVLLNGLILDTSEQDDKNDIKIPQIDIILNYTKRVADPVSNYEQLKEEQFRKVLSRTEPFSDNRVIEFVSDDLMLYIEELNTDMLSENFEIEMFEIIHDGDTRIGAGSSVRPKDSFDRKLFEHDYQRIMGGLMTEESINAVDRNLDDVRDMVFNYTTSSVGYYFNVLKDYEIDPVLACKSAEIYNKESYYIDLDFECQNLLDNPIYNVDLYGPVTEPEICP
jgi:hypothetical protein